MYRLRPYIDLLAIDNGILVVSPYLEALRLVQQNRKACCSVLAIHTSPNSYKELFDSKKMAEERYGVDKEQERLQRVLKAKEVGKNNITFGGNTIFGSFIAPLKELGYTDSEILYERGYGYLRMMLADKISSVYLSDEEISGVSKADGGRLIDANDPTEAENLRAMFASRGIT